ncbi:MAG: type II toxin-antitoxin system RelE/ParE family toxin [Microcystaceae cyanobacterium]
MAYRVVWSSKALEDVDTIATYIARDSPSYAAAVVQRILDITRGLQSDPLTGSIIPEFNDDSFREKLAYTYRLIYYLKEDAVTVAAIVHTKGIIRL